MNKSTVILNKTQSLVHRIEEAAEHFQIDMNDVEDGHLDHLQTIKNRHDSVFNTGAVRSYRVTEEGVVGFLNASGEMI
jgi:hypothetical protein